MSAPVGMLVGGGQLPLEVARGLIDSGRSVHVVAIAGEADQDWTPFPHTIVGWGRIGGMLAALKGAGCRELIIIGRVRRPDPWKLRPDLGLLLALPRVLRLVTAGGDDSLLRRCLRFFEDHGLTVRGPAELVPGLVAAAGSIGGERLSSSNESDIALGFDVVRSLGRFDIGQAVVISQGRLVAVEGAEGTDGLLQRLPVGAAAGVLVKCPKPGQELRIDMPAIGPRTVELAAAKGLAGIAVEAGRVLIAEREFLADKASAARMFVEGVDRAPAVNASGPLPRTPVVVNGRKPKEQDLRDAVRAIEVVAQLQHYAADVAVLVSRRHVLAVGIDEAVPEFIARVRRLRQWGDRGWLRRGVLGLTSTRQLDLVGMEQASAARYAGIATLRMPVEPGADMLKLSAERLGISLLACNEGEHGDRA